MNKKILLSICILFITYCSLGQKSNVYKYYKYVNKAELARDIHKDKKASKYYEKSFKYNRPFAKDAFQYMWVYANKHYGSESTALQCAMFNAQRGMLWKKSLKKDTVFYKKITSIKDTTQLTIIPSLKNALDSLLHMDQQVRISDTIPMKQIALTDSMNMQKLAELFESYGYINEDNAGERAITVIQMIFIHNSKTQTEEPPFYILENAVRAGTFDGREYMYLYDLCQYFRNDIINISDSTRKDSRFGTSMYQYLTVGDILFIYPPKNIKKTNANRKSLLMAETWKDYEKKLINTFRNGGAGFVQLTPMTFSSTEEEDEKKDELKQEIISGKVKGKYIKGERFILPWF